MRQIVLGSLLLGVALAGCGDPFAVLPATKTNTIDTLDLFAVNGTGLRKPSGYVLAGKVLIQIGISPPPVVNAPPFDFLFRVDPQAGPQFVPFFAVAPAPVGQSSSGHPGLLVTATPFDAITEGQQSGYTVDKPINLRPGLVLLVQSSLPNDCFLGIPYYAKIEVISFDETVRSVKFRILTDNNCGYRGLEPGLPKK